mgnify:CR=1 FL=1
MKLYIAEKPSLGRAIAHGISSNQQKSDGFITLGNGDVVSWCIGHLLEQAQPDKYDEKYKSWRSEDLPIIPQRWQLTPKSKTKKQLSVLRKLVKQADSIVNAGDPDREGQLLVDEVISYLGVKGAKLSNVQRLLINDLNIAAVKKALNSLRVNKDFQPLSISALARSRADWLFGLNMTRAYTIAGQSAGYQGVLSVGRVQTPILGLVVKREQEIANFVAKPFYEVNATLCSNDSNQEFIAKWQPSEACERYQDEQGRVIFRKLAENVVARTKGQQARVLAIKDDSKKQFAPLPFNLSSLQIDAAKRYGFSAKQVLDTCQQLYEKHQLITYPRSDNRYLPLAHHKQAKDVAAAIGANVCALTQAGANANLEIKSKAWNDKKVEAHHAIIPTHKHASFDRLTASEQKIYQMVATQYLAQFYPAMEFSQQVVDVDIAGGLFRAKAKQVKALGWKVLFKNKEQEHSELPALTVGQALSCLDSVINDKMTEPPKSFTDATLLGAMTGISRYVADPEIKKVLKETDGLGTEATRASIIELLFKRQFLVRNGKLIKATDAGIALINALPLSATTPDMTALWESKLNQIANKSLGYDEFMLPLQQSLEQLMAQASTVPLSALSGLKASPKNSFKWGYRRKKRSASNA